MIYLSDFRTAGKDVRAVSIAAITPKGFKGEVRKDLAPPFSLVKALKEKKINVTRYCIEYTRKIYDTVDFDEIAKNLDGKVLLCYCDKTQFCHRTVLGLYITAETGIEVEEIGGYADNFARLVKNKEYPVEFYLDADTIKEYNLTGLNTKNEPELPVIGLWRELKNRGLLHLYQETV